MAPISAINGYMQLLNVINGLIQYRLLIKPCSPTIKMGNTAIINTTDVIQAITLGKANCIASFLNPLIIGLNKKP